MSGNWPDRVGHWEIGASVRDSSYILGCTCPVGVVTLIVRAMLVTIWAGQFDCKGRVSDHNMSGGEEDKRPLITEDSSMTRLPCYVLLMPFG